MPDQLTFVVATRGGAASRVAIKAAAIAAKEQSAQLKMLYIVDTSYHEVADLAAEPAMVELTWIGSVLLELAQKRIEGMGVSAEPIVLEGNVRNQIIAYLREQQVDKLFLGAPRGTTQGVFGDDEIEKFAREIEAITSVNVEVTYPEYLAA